MRNWIIGAIVLLIILIAAYLFFSQQQTKTPETTGVTKTEQEATSVATEGALETIELVAQKGFTGTATATRSFDGTTFLHGVTADIADPAAGKFYEGWLVKKTPTLTFFSTGKLVNNNGRYELVYTDSQNYSDYKDVVITEETESLGLDGKPETHVLEGTFQ